MLSLAAAALPALPADLISSFLEDTAGGDVVEDLASHFTASALRACFAFADTNGGADCADTWAMLFEAPEERLLGACGACGRGRPLVGPQRGLADAAPRARCRPRRADLAERMDADTASLEERLQRVRGAAQPAATFGASVPLPASLTPETRLARARRSRRSRATTRRT